MEKTLISAIGSSPGAVLSRHRGRSSGFSLVELLVALTIAGMVMGVAAPASVRFYEGMQRRQAVRDTVTLLASAREKALSSGYSQDVMVRPSARRIWMSTREQIVPDGLTLTVHGAAELNQNDTGIIRFYPDGSASGGGIDIARADGSGTRINVDWLIGTVQQQPLGEG
ncbi:MAG: Tfp pilus assembly protein FimT/FimU [Congregibacter sp.]